MNRQEQLVCRLVEAVLADISARIPATLLYEGPKIPTVVKPGIKTTAYDDSIKLSGKRRSTRGGDPRLGSFGHDTTNVIEDEQGRLIKVSANTSKDLQVQRSAKDINIEDLASSKARVPTAKPRARNIQNRKDQIYATLRQYGIPVGNIYNQTYTPATKVQFASPENVESKNIEYRMGETFRVRTVQIVIHIVPLLVHPLAPGVFRVSRATVGDIFVNVTAKDKSTAEVVKVEKAKNLEDNKYTIIYLTDKNGKDLSGEAEEDRTDTLTTLELVKNDFQLKVNSRNRNLGLADEEQKAIWMSIPKSIKEKLRDEIKEAIEEHVADVWEYLPEEVRPKVPVKFEKNIASRGALSSVEYDVQASITLPPLYGTEAEVKKFLDKFANFNKEFKKSTQARSLPRAENAKNPVGKIVKAYPLAETKFSTQRGRWTYVISEILSQKLDEFFKRVAKETPEKALDIKIALLDAAGTAIWRQISETKRKKVAEALGLQYVDKEIEEVDPVTGDITVKTHTVVQHASDSGGSNIQELSKQSGAWVNKMAMYRLFDLLAMANGYGSFINFVRTITSGGKYADCGPGISEEEKKLKKAEGEMVSKPKKVEAYSSPVVCGKYIDALVPNFMA